MIDAPSVRALVMRALEEDMPFGDVTTELLIPKKQKGEAVILVKEKGVICGLPLIPIIFQELGVKVSVRTLVAEGQEVKAGSIVARISGNAAGLLKAERTVLNFLQRLSGVATLARDAVRRSGGLTILDTRKTTPGLRLLEKYAVACGGAVNHRFDLSHAVLVKNNHVDLTPGGMKAVVKKLIRSKIPYQVLIIEVRNQKELKDALRAKPTSIMLDNMSDSELKKAVKIIRKSSPALFVEASGGITATRFAQLRSAGIDAASLGSLTTQFRALDISWRIKRKR